MEHFYNNFSVLFIDDDPIVRSLAKTYLKNRVNIYVVEKPSVAFNILEKEKIDVVITDFILPEMNGLDVLEKIKSNFPGVDVIMISATSEIDTVIGALRKGAVDYCKKPFDFQSLWLSIERTKRFSQLQAQFEDVVKKNEKLKAEINRELNLEIIGSSKEILQVKEQMKMVARTPDTSVLLIGESGTGKELVARGIHMLSKRNNEFFGAVNMSAIPDTLFESEFFGHKKGSFTGAILDKAGWFESSDKGTLFLDEIGDMPLLLQVKLLRVLEDSKYTKVGTQIMQNFDIRIISATNKTIHDLTNGECFRLDLFHRISTFIIHIPPLRERKSDIPVLAEYFVNKISEKMGRKITSINEDAYKLLNSYHFPGNIRELRNMIERAVIMCPGNELKAEHFYIFDYNSDCYDQCNITEEMESDSHQIFDLKELEKETIIKALKKVDFNKSEAARLLNIEWNALYRRIQKYEIELPY